METETIDKLFLELSQVTQATTAKETAYVDAMASACMRIRQIDDRGGLGGDVHAELKAIRKLLVDAIAKRLRLTP